VKPGPGRKTAKLPAWTRYNNGVMNNPITPKTTPKQRFKFLKSMRYAAPLSEADTAELKKLASRFDKKYAKWMDENPELA